MFGVDLEQFNPERISDIKEPSRAKGYHPFGIGSTYCPRLFLVKWEVYMFVALVLDRFSIKLDESQGRQELPAANEKKHRLAATSPIGDLLRLKPRKNKI